MIILLIKVFIFKELFYEFFKKNMKYYLNIIIIIYIEIYCYKWNLFL